MSAIKIDLFKDCGKINTLLDIKYRNGVIDGLSTLQNRLQLIKKEIIGQIKKVGTAH